MPGHLKHCFYLILLFFLLLPCQPVKAESMPQLSAAEQVSTPNQIGKSPMVPMQNNIIMDKKSKTSLTINLNLPQEQLEKIDADSQQELRSELHDKMSVETTEQRKIEIRGEVLIDQEEEELINKVDGGKVEISVPFH